jgi:hypothetical protein
MVNIHAQRQKSAAGDLDRQLLAAQKGFPVDPKAVEKTAKKAGLPLMKPEDMKGLLEKPADGAKPTINTQEPDQYKQAYNVAAIKDVGDRQKAETSHGIDGMIRTAVQNHALRGANETQVLQYTKNLMTLKDAALNGDPRALGKLSAAGELKIDVPTQVWQSYSPQQKNKYLEMSRGAETEAEKNGRIQAAATHLIDAGAFTSPEAAYQAAASLADGKGLTPEMKATMRPTSVQDLTKEVGIVDNLAAIGLSGPQIWDMARGANLTGISNYFPKNFTPIQQKMMSIRQQEANTGSANAQTERMGVTGFTDSSGQKIPGRLESEGKRTAIEQQEADARKLAAENTANRIQAAMKTAADKDFIATYTAMVDIKRAGGRVDPQVMNLMQEKLVEKGGGTYTIEDVKSWYNYIIGGSHKEMKVGIAPGSDTIPADSTTDDSTDPAASAAGRPQ